MLGAGHSHNGLKIFVLRLEAAVAWDFTQASFTRDGNWHDLDLSNIIPEGVYAVMLSHASKSGVANKYLIFAHPDYQNNFTAAVIYFPAANGYIGGTLIVGVKDGKISYKASDANVNDINLSVTGWFK